ncbi:adenylate/guanylate cyclase domain-containing protein [Prescottella defluvii]|uniref:adenylate/guanylate cyclase domain-containing protein n=1 Tax=Prescottella defluvii TaxID=1323361 RepID=UPI0004F37D25|nr:adenylate/guanylate cyclase domain-containing protein [Prescottella defluvii]
MYPPETRYVERDGHALAYQVLGEDDTDGRDKADNTDVVLFLEIGLHPDLMWTDPHIHCVFERAATFCRMVYFQRRGFGLSDPVVHVPTLEQQADDVLAIMDAAGMRRATLVGIGSTCGALALIAAREPDRVSGLVFQQPFVEGALREGVDLPRGWTAGARDHFVDGWRSVYDNWGSGQVIAMWDPTQDSSFNRRLMALLERCSATPVTARAHLEWLFRIDYFDALASIQCPTRVLHSARSAVPLEASKQIANAIEHGALHVLPPLPPGTSMGEAWIPVLEHIREVATGIRRPVDADRYLATVLFTDVAGSTETLARIGDGRYHDLRGTHERQVRNEVEESGGRLVNVAGDGTLSVFDGPAAAVRCGRTVCRQASDMGLGVRAGVHTGEIEGVGIEMTGMTVHVGARIGATAGPGEVLVSRTVRDLVVGSGLAFTDRGTHDLKGVPGHWRLYALTETRDDSREMSRNPLNLNLADRLILGAARRAPNILRAAGRIAVSHQHRRAR